MNILLVVLLVLFVLQSWLVYILGVDAVIALRDQYRNKHGIEETNRLFGTKF